MIIRTKSILGNDLARVLRWGPGYTGGEDPLNLLRDVIEAEEIRLDRWTVVFHPEDKPDEPALKAPTNTSGKSKKKKIQQVPISQQNRHHQLPAISTLSISGHLILKISTKKYFITNSTIDVKSEFPSMCNFLSKPNEKYSYMFPSECELLEIL